jgi:two-component system cell cycle sensor histidine kinase/response regulator CckA
MNLEGIRVLLVEDNPGDVRLFSELVRSTGAKSFRFEHVSTLQAGLEKVNSDAFDVMLLDLSLPDEQGLATLTRAHTHAPNVPIVVLTGRDDEALAIQAVRAGAQDYLFKGQVDGDLLVRSIRYATERGRSLRALEWREEHFRSLIENSLDLVSILNVDGTIRYASPSHERILGFPVEELVGKNVLSFVHPDDVAGVRSAFAGTAAVSLQCRFRHKDGSWRVLESFGRNLSGLAAVSGVVVNSRDITDRKRLEEQLHHSQRLEAIGRLAGGVAHDFNNLLMIISGYSQILLDSMRSVDPARSQLEQVVKAAERATDLTHQLLAVSRRQVTRPTVINLNALLQAMDLMLRRVIGEDIEFVSALAPGLEMVRVDPGQIEQVVLNLAVNARDAMPDGGRLTIETFNVNYAGEHYSENLNLKPGHHIALVISDTGCGMDQQVLSRIFEPFFTTKEHGNGLGLSTSYGIIKQNGGDILVDSKPGGGTAFRIYLPAVAQSDADLVESRPSSLLRGTETILLVEDEDSVRRVVETMLKRHGYEVLSSTSAAEAMAIVDRHPKTIDLVITDMMMPGMNGREMAERLLKQRPTMRVLFVSGYGEPVDSLGGRAFLQKPFTIDEMTHKIHEVLHASPQQKSASGDF